MKINLGDVGIIALVSVLFYLSVREPLPSAIIGYVSKPQPALKKKAQAKLKTTQATRKKSSPSYAQHRQKEEAEGSHGDNPTAGKGGVVAIPGTARWLATATPAQKAAYAAIRARQKALVKKRIELKISMAAAKIRQQLLAKLQTGYKPISFGGGNVGALGAQNTGLEHGGLGGAVPNVGTIGESIKAALGIGKPQTPSLDTWINNKQKACKGNATCEQNTLKQIDKEVEESINATASTLSKAGGAKKPGLPGIDPSLAMA